ncbi:MAG: hypothetical protein OCU22_03650 [Canidatus Methanoxibalbensis ujae]|nr:hypothetical protein [Candidatus Methanoxibalbensis ujae]
MEGKEWAKWKVKTEKMQSYELLSGLLFFLTGILSFWTFFALSSLIEKLLKYGFYAFDVEGVSDLMAGTLTVMFLTILCFLGGLHCYNKAKEIEEEIESEEE